VAITRVLPDIRLVIADGGDNTRVRRRIKLQCNSASCHPPAGLTVAATDALVSNQGAAERGPFVTLERGIDLGLCHKIGGVHHEKANRVYVHVA